jgi:hypothetical protein
VNAVVLKQLIVGVFNFSIQLCDNYMFWFRFIAVKPKTPWYMKWLCHLYVLTVLTPWVTAIFPMPLFLDVNTKSYSRINHALNELYAYGQIAYNTYFTIEFGQILYQLAYDPDCKYSKAAGIIAFKSIIHCICR